MKKINLLRHFIAFFLITIMVQSVIAFAQSGLSFHFSQVFSNLMPGLGVALFFAFRIGYEELKKTVPMPRFKAERARYLMEFSLFSLFITFIVRLASHFITKYPYHLMWEVLACAAFTLFSLVISLLFSGVFWEKRKGDKGNNQSVQ